MEVSAEEDWCFLVCLQQTSGKLMFDVSVSISTDRVAVVLSNLLEHLTFDTLVSHANLMEWFCAGVVPHDRGHPEPIPEVFCLHSLQTNPECRHNQQVTSST